MSFVEKPAEPPSNLAATACYLFHREHLKLVATYLEEGNVPDQPGRFVEWLHRRAPVYGYRFSGEWLDIGDRDQLLEADNRAEDPTQASPREPSTFRTERGRAHPHPQIGWGRFPPPTAETLPPATRRRSLRDRAASCRRA